MSLLHTDIWSISPHPQSGVTWCHHFVLQSVLRFLMLLVSADHIKAWMQLPVTSLTSSFEPTSCRASVRAGHSKNWDKFSRGRTALNSHGADLGAAKLHWLHVNRKRAYSHISSALLSQLLWDFSSPWGEIGRLKPASPPPPPTLAYITSPVGWLSAPNQAGMTGSHMQADFISPVG